MKYLVSGMADDTTLGAIVKAFGGRVTLSAIGASQPGVVKDAAEEVHKPHPPAKTRAVRRATKSNGEGAEWPAKGSIYDVVLQSLREKGPLAPIQLRDILKEGGFSPDSVNSALGRLAKSQKVQKAGNGVWAAT